MAINPLQQPINYAVDVQSPFEAALGGLKLGAGLAEIDAAQQKRQLEVNALQQAQQRQTDLANLYKNPNATATDYAVASAFLPKDQREGVLKTFDMLTAEQQQGSLRNAAQVYSAVKSGQIDIAKNLLKEQAAAFRNSNREQDAKATETYLQMIELNPTGAQATVGIMTSILPGGKDLLANVDKALSTIRSEVPPADDGFTLLTKEEVTKAGLPPGAYQKSGKGEIKAIVKEPLVSVSVGAQGQRDTLALKELDVPRAKEFSEAAASARKFATDSRVISNLLKGAGGGRLIKLTTELQRDFGFESPSVSANDLANSLATRGATQIRAPGSGSTSDIEFKSFLQAFPSLSNSERGRELMSTYAEAFAKRSARLADHARKLIREDRYSEEEIGTFDQNLGPVLNADFYELAKQGRRSDVPVYTPQAQPAATPVAPRTVESVLRQYLPKKQ
jgi:hypothetical protein